MDSADGAVKLIRARIYVDVIYARERISLERIVSKIQKSVDKLAIEKSNVRTSSVKFKDVTLRGIE